MTFLLLTICGCVAIYVVTTLLRRQHLKAQLEQLDEQIAHIPPYSEVQKTVASFDKDLTTDIIRDFGEAFSDTYITFAQKERFTSHFEKYYYYAYGWMWNPLQKQCPYRINTGLLRYCKTMTHITGTFNLSVFYIVNCELDMIFLEMGMITIFNL